MFCGKCGAKNADDAKFCQSCGYQFGDIGNSKEAETITSHQSKTEIQTLNKTKVFPKKAIIGITVSVVAIIIGLIVIISVVMKEKKTINLNDYLVFESTGYDGYGKVSASINWDEIEEKYGSKISYTSKAKKEYGRLISLTSPIDLLKDYVKVKLDTYNEVSNGDNITYTWTIDEKLSKYVKCNVKYKDDTYTVSGLSKVATFDAFADLEVTFSGVSPNGSISYDYSGSELDYYDFICDKYDGLSNGDTVTFTISDNMEYYVEQYGRVPETLEKEYKVEGLSSYVKQLSDISAEGLKAMQQQAHDVYYSYVARNWSDSVSLETFTYIGNYLLTAKSPDSWGENNTLYLVYKAQSIEDYSYDGESYKGSTDIFWYIAYNNLIVDANGELEVDVTVYDSARATFEVDSEISNGWWNTKSWEYYGYRTLDELYKNVVTSKIDVFNHEDSVDESLAPAAIIIEAPVVSDDTLVNDGYILVNSDTELVTSEELDKLSADDCKIAREEIYARHGCKFANEEIQAHFDACGWYTATIELGEFDENELSEIELQNKTLIDEYILAKGY